MAVASPTISRLPTIALASPPGSEAPGGGVIFVKSAHESPDTPSSSVVQRIQRSHTSPKAIARSDRASEIRL